MQVHSDPTLTGLLDRVSAEQLAGRRGLEAWRALLLAHASLIRTLDTDLQAKTGLALADFDVLAQLSLAGGELRMTELAARALISRSGMTRRCARLVDQGLLRRASADLDGRGVVVGLTDLGVQRLVDSAPVHAQGIADLFVAKLDDSELGILEQALGKVKVSCSFG